MIPTVVRAGQADAAVLSHLIADAFLDLAPSQWLIGDQATRRQVFPGYFRLYVEHAITEGIAHTTADRAAVALWLPAGSVPPRTGSAAPRFQAFDATLDRHHPADPPHEYLAILAVHPDRQGRGIGSALLRARHTVLDRTGIPAYLEASSPRARDLYLRHGYVPRPGAPYHLPGSGPPMWPMWREPGC